MLTDFQKTGCINIPSRPVKERIVFDGPIGLIITDFLDKKIEKDYRNVVFTAIITIFPNF